MLRAGFPGPITTASLASITARTSSVTAGRTGAVETSSRTSVPASAHVQYSKSGRRPVPVSTIRPASVSLTGRMVAPTLSARHWISTASVRVFPLWRRAARAIWTARARSPTGKGSPPATFGR